MQVCECVPLTLILGAVPRVRNLVPVLLASPRCGATLKSGNGMDGARGSMNMVRRTREDRSGKAGSPIVHPRIHAPPSIHPSSVFTWSLAAAAGGDVAAAVASAAAAAAVGVRTAEAELPREQSNEWRDYVHPYSHTPRARL